MNHRETIAATAASATESTNNCEKILKSYEKYCQQQPTKFSRKHMERIVDFISTRTLIDPSICQNVMNHFFDIMTEETKKKIPFFN